MHGISNYFYKSLNSLHIEYEEEQLDLILNLFLTHLEMIN